MHNYEHKVKCISAIRFSTPDNMHVILSIEQYFYHAKLTELIASYLYSRLIYYYFFISGNINKPYRYSISKRKAVYITNDAANEIVTPKTKIQHCSCLRAFNTG